MCGIIRTTNRYFVHRKHLLAELYQCQQRVPLIMNHRVFVLLRGVCVCGQKIGSVLGKNIIIIYSQ